jgi:hypothetical protein
VRPWRSGLIPRAAAPEIAFEACVEACEYNFIRLGVFASLASPGGDDPAEVYRPASIISMLAEELDPQFFQFKT